MLLTGDPPVVRGSSDLRRYGGGDGGGQEAGDKAPPINTLPSVNPGLPESFHNIIDTFETCRLKILLFSVLEF